MDRYLDERQFAVRGRIFKHTAFTLIGLLLLESLLETFFEITFFAGPWSKMFTALAGVTVMCAEMVWRGAYPLTERRQFVLFSVLGAAGILSLIAGILDLACYGENFTAGRALSESSALLAMGVMFIFTAAVFFVKFAGNRAKKREGQPFR